MENLKTFLKNQQETYNQNNTFDINLCTPISENISQIFSQLDRGQFLLVFLDPFWSIKRAFFERRIYSENNLT